MRILLVMALALLATAAQAQTLTTDAASRFLDSLSEVNAFGRSLDRAQPEESLPQNAMPRMGEPFAPYSRGMELLKAEDALAYADMGDIVGGHGFTTVEAWARTGDQVMTAYMANELDGEAMQIQEQLSPDMLQQLPTPMRAQMEAAMAMMETVRDVPPEHIQAIQPLLDRIEALMDGTGR